MSRLGRLFRSRIALAVVGALLVGGGGAYWAVISGAPASRQAGNSLMNTDPTNTASADDPTATTDPNATATTVPRGPTATPRPTATPCPTSTPVAAGTSVHWQGRVVSVNTAAFNFALRVGCGHPTIVVPPGFNNWTGTGLGAVTSFAALRAGANAVVDATSQGDGTYLATSINAHNDT